jgi:glycosyltransferase involved in cell wall biosynthesis
MKRPPLSVVIPAKDEAQALPGVLRAFKGAGLPRGWQGLVVDDGSSDGSGALARRAGWRVLRTSGLGYGGALQAGFAACKGEWLAFLDADGTYPPAELGRLWRQRPAGGMVLADRFTPANRMPFERRLGNRAFNALATLKLARRVPDLCTGQRIFHRSLAPLAQGLPLGLDFSPAFTLACARQGAPLAWVPIPYLDRQGHSKLGLWGDGWRFLGAILKG